MISRYSYFLEKSSYLIYRLTIGEGNAKERLIECENEIYSMLLTPIPDELIALREELHHKLFDNGRTLRNGKPEESLAKSLQGKRNSSASKMIKDIINLHQKVESYIEYIESK